MLRIPNTALESKEEKEVVCGIVSHWFQGQVVKVIDIHTSYYLS